MVSSVTAISRSIRSRSDRWREVVFPFMEFKHPVDKGDDFVMDGFLLMD